MRGLFQILMPTVEDEDGQIVSVDKHTAKLIRLMWAVRNAGHELEELSHRAGKPIQIIVSRFNNCVEVTYFYVKYCDQDPVQPIRRLRVTNRPHLFNWAKRIIETLPHHPVTLLLENLSRGDCSISHQEQVINECCV